MNEILAPASEGTPAVDPSPAPTPRRDAAGPGRPTPQGSDPWQRFGWVMGVIWLVFLAFPLSAVLAQPHPAAKVTGVAAIAAFGAIYVYGFVHFPQSGASLRTCTLTLLGLVALGVVLSTSIGIQSIAVVPFIVAFSMFHQPFTRAIVITVVSLIAIAVLITITDEWGDFWFLLAIVALVALTTGATRWIEIQQHHHTQLQNRYRLITEQERVARDVHDVLGHSLTVITVKSELARRLIDVDPGRAAEEIGEIESLSREALSEIRATVAGLRVVRLNEEIDNARSALTSAGIDGRFPDDPAALDPRHRMVAAWVVREAVTNVVRHSGARACTVEITPNSLAVLDDGQGFDHQGATHPGDAEGSGLQGLRERVESSGGTLLIASEPSGGTRVEVRW